MFALVRKLRHDKLLGIATVIMALLCVHPLAKTTIVPFIDLPHHVALSSLLWDVALGRAPAAVHYELDLLPTPYWSAYVLLALAGRVFGIYAGTKLVVAVAILAIPLGVMRLMIALGRDPRLGLWAFVLPWDFNLYYGWLNHVLGVGLALFVMAQIFEAKTPREAIRCWPLGVFVALTHILPFTFLGVAAGIGALLKPGVRRALCLHSVALAGPVIVLVPWLWRSLAPALSGGPRVDPGLVFDSAGVKVQSLFKHTLGSGLVTPSGRSAEAAAFAVLLLGPVFLFLLRRSFATRATRTAAAPVAAALLLYFALPLAVARPVEHWGTYPRFGSLILIGMLLLPDVDLSGKRALALLPGVVTAIAMLRAVSAQLGAFDVQIATFYEVARKVPQGASLLPLCYENGFPAVKLPMGESLPAYITAATGGFNPYLFGQPTNPIHYKRSARLPAPPAWGRVPAQFSMSAHGRHYDYILVQGLAWDPLPDAAPASEPSGEPVLIFERGRYRLYEVKRAPGAEPGR